MRFGLRTLLVALLLVISAGSPVFGSVLMTGELTAGLRVDIDDDPWAFGTNHELRLALDSFFTDGAAHVSVLGCWDTESEASLVLNEAYVELFGTDYDVRVGKQRIVWGTAVEINPTNVVNPINPDNPMGDRQAVPALRGDYYLGHNYRMSFVWVPVFHPAVASIELEHPQWGTVIMEGEEVPRTLDNSEFAVRAAALGLSGVDASISYFRGRERVPFLTTPMAPGQEPMAEYRRIHAFGFDFASSVGDLGYWGEAGYFVPEDGDSYFQWIAGADYSFPNDLMVVGQFYRRGDPQGNTTNYGIVGSEVSFNTIHTARFGLLYNIDTGTAMLSPEVVFSLADSVSFTLGARTFVGDGALGMPFVKESSEIHAKVKVHF